VTGSLCALCIDNTASHELTIYTGTGRTTGPVNLCWPCLTERLDKLKHDFEARLHDIPVLLGPVTGFHVEVLDYG
jgi:hypothetical protein